VVERRFSLDRRHFFVELRRSSDVPYNLRLVHPEDTNIAVRVDDGPTIVQQIREHDGDWQKQQEHASRER
jgi:hypothetical protein